MTSPQEKFDAIWQTVDETIAALDSGKSVDTSILETQGKELCQLIAQLPPEQAQDYQPKLQLLVEHLTNIAQQMTERKAQVEEDINSLNTSANVYNAYQNASKLGHQGE
jgi:ABC-type transporter Mla subunit MlaD